MAIPQRSVAPKLRMIGVFGLREPELAATAILDAQWDRPYAKVDPLIFRDDMEREGYRQLLRDGWIDRNNVPTRHFWFRVHGR